MEENSELHYKEAYLRLFGRIADLLEEQPNREAMLCALQAALGEAEEIAVGE
ncbi:MAG: hypothetical protein ACOX6P_06885 [Candidatus Merdivicinus sp.]|jgi:hypothetical protein